MIAFRRMVDPMIQVVKTDPVRRAFCRNRMEILILFKMDIFPVAKQNGLYAGQDAFHFFLRDMG